MSSNSVDQSGLTNTPLTTTESPDPSLNMTDPLQSDISASPGATSPAEEEAEAARMEKRDSVISRDDGMLEMPTVHSPTPSPAASPSPRIKRSANPPGIKAGGSPKKQAQTSPVHVSASPRPSANQIFLARQNSKKGSTAMATSPPQNIPCAPGVSPRVRTVSDHHPGTPGLQSPHSLPRSEQSDTTTNGGMSYGALDSKDPHYMAIQARILAKQRIRTESQRSVVSTTAVENGKVSTVKPSLKSMIGVVFGSTAGSKFGSSRFGSSRFGRSNSKLSSASGGSTSRVNYVTEATSFVPSFSSAFSIDQYAVTQDNTQKWLDENEGDLADPGNFSTSVGEHIGNADIFDDPDYTDTVKSTDSAGSLLRRSLSVPSEYISRPRSAKRHVAEIFEDFFVQNKSAEQLDSTEDILSATSIGSHPAAIPGAHLKWSKQMDDLIECPEYLDSLESTSSKTGLLARHAKQLAFAPLKPPLTPTDEVQEIEFEKAKEIEKIQCMKNLIVLSISFAFLFAAYLSLRNLASSLYHEGGLGMYTLSTVYGSLFFGCITATTIVQRLRPKKTLICCFSGILVYILTNFYPSFYTIVPAAVLVGFSLSNMWTAHATYLTNIAVTYADCTGMKLGEALSKFNGIFFLFFQCSQVVGGIASSLVLMKSATHHEAGETNETWTSLENITVGGVSEYGHCGANYCHINAVDTVSVDIDRNTHYMLIGIYAASALVGLLILIIFLDKLEGPMKKTQNSIGTQLVACFKFFYDRRVLMLLGLMFYSLLQISFMFGEFTKAFVTCTLGMHVVGFAMVCMSGCAAISSFVCGRIQPYVGRMALFLAAGAIDFTLLLTMLLWTPTPDTVPVIFVLAGLWGIGDGVFITQVVSLFGLLFSHNKEPAFAALKMCQAVGAFSIFITGPYICTQLKIIIVGGVLLVSMTGYVCMEMYMKRQKRKETWMEAPISVKVVLKGPTNL